MEKTMKARVQHKHDIESNWLKATNFTPLVGEIIVYDPDESYGYPRIKIGDGETNINSLPFITEDYAKIADIPTKPADIGAQPAGNYLTSIPSEYVTESELNAKGYLTDYTESDPTVPDWAKAATKPAYTASEVGALPSTTKIPSTLSELGEDSEHRVVTDVEKAAWGAKSNFSGSYNDLSDKPAIPSIDGLASTGYVDNAVKNKVDKDGNKVLSTNDYTTAEKNKLSGIAAGAEVNVNADWNATSGDAQILNKPTLGTMAAKNSVAKTDLVSEVQSSLGKADTALQPGDISDWAKQSSKPAYTASEVGALPSTTKIPSALSDLNTDTTHRVVTDAEKNSWNAKAEVSAIPTKVSQLDNDSKFLTSFTETDPTVPDWAKASSKPSYTKSEVGLGNVDNTSDTNKPVSTAQATAIADAKKAGTDAQSNLTTHINNKSNPHGVTKAQVGLGNVDNVKQYSANNPPPYPVTSVNGKTGDIILSIEEIIPEYWQSALDNGVEAINTTLCTTGRNKSAFLFYTDVHWNYGSQMSPTLLKYLYNHTGMTKTFFGGDIVNNEGTDYDAMAYLWDWRSKLKGLPNHHSVVGNHDDGNATNNLFSEQYIYGYLLSAEETLDIVRGDSGLYYYVDTPSEKTRYLCLDTAYQGVGDNQKEFVKDALLTTPEGWHIVAIAHIWHDTNYNVNPPIPADVSSDASILLSMFDSYNSRNGDYAECGGWVEFCIGGHTHWDHDSKSATGIPIILVETDSRHVRSGLNYAAGTTTEASVNGIIADYDHHKIHVVRIGRGESRDIAVTNYLVKYNNVLREAGFTENIYISSSNGYVEKGKDGVDLTGYIKVLAGDVIRLKNVTMPDVNDYANKVYFFKDNNGVKEGVNAFSMKTTTASTVYKDGNLVEFTIDGSWIGISGSTYGFIRIGAANIDNTSIITVNEPIE